MLVEIIRNIALILDDREVLEYIKTADNNFEQTLANDQTQKPANLDLYITLVNFVLTDIAQNFLCYKCTQDLVSDNACRLMLVDFTHVPCNIKAIKNADGKRVRFYATEDYVVVGEAGKLHYIEYAYIPETLTSLDDSVMLPMGLDTKTLVYGVLSEFYATKMQYTQANIWEQKFKQGLKNMLRRYKDLRFAYRSLI